MEPARYSVVDVETTGLRSCDRVTEIAVISFDHGGAQTSVFESVLDPERDPGPSSIHGLTAKDCRGAPTFRGLARSLHERLVGTVLVAHNLRFDWNALRREFARCGVHFLHEPGGLCTAQGCRRLGVPAQLANACTALEITRLAAHGARPDAEATADLWTALGRRGAFAGLRLQPLRAGLGAHRLPRANLPQQRQADRARAKPPGRRQHHGR